MSEPLKRDQTLDHDPDSDDWDECPAARMGEVIPEVPTYI